MKDERSEYDLQAEKFLADTGTSMECHYMGHLPYFDDDKEARSVWNVIFTRGKIKECFRFGQSLHNSWDKNVKTPNSILPRVAKKVAPTAYDVLACLINNDPGTFREFCSDYGSNPDSIKDRNTYDKVCEEYEKVSKLWRDVMDKLQEIQ